jgi:PEP-CTERM motif
VHFTATAAVPEPATWMMMILGFGFVGAAVRRRRSDEVAALA